MLYADIAVSYKETGEVKYAFESGGCLLSITFMVCDRAWGCRTSNYKNCITMLT